MKWPGPAFIASPVLPVHPVCVSSAATARHPSPEPSFIPELTRKGAQAWRRVKTKPEFVGCRYSLVSS